MMNSTHKSVLVGVSILAVLVVGVTLMQGTKKTSPVHSAVSSRSSVNATIANTAAASSDPEDIVAGLYSSAINNTATKDGLQIVSAKVEDNTDSSGKPVSDRLEVTLKNTSTETMTNFDIYYLMTDIVTKAQEGYNKKLTGLTLAPGETKTIYFDGAATPGHYSANKSNLYYKALNGVRFDITVSAAGFKPQTVQAHKAAGGAEQKD